MTNDRDDERLQRIFDELRHADRAMSPPFARVWTSVAAGKRRRSPRVMIATAVGCVGVAVAVVVFALQRRAPSGLEAAAQLAAWRSPTAALLRVPGSDILRSVPSLDASLVRPETLQPVTGGGTP